jgi:hypothetical protein
MFFAWMGPIPTKIDTRSCPCRELDGNSTQNRILFYQFQGDDIANIPLAPPKWNRIDHQEQMGVRRQLKFHIYEICFEYNLDTQFLEVKFKYNMMAPFYGLLKKKKISTGICKEYGHV